MPSAHVARQARKQRLAGIDKPPVSGSLTNDCPPGELPPAAPAHRWPFPHEVKHMDRAKIEHGFREVLEGLGVDLRHPNLKDTPRRTAEAWVNELCVGLTEPEPDMDLIPLEEGHVPGLVALDQIPVKSICAHHLLPFTGQAIVAYVPRDTICGLSKLSRVVAHFARRPQLQEQLTQQIAQYVQRVLNPQGVGVLIRASHACMEFRGVNHPGSMTTTMVLGCLESSPQFRAEFLALAHPHAVKPAGA